MGFDAMSKVDRYRGIGRTYCFYLQGREENRTLNEVFLRQTRTRRQHVLHKNVDKDLHDHTVSHFIRQ
jgi:hypothetical protein